MKVCHQADVTRDGCLLHAESILGHFQVTVGTLESIHPQRGAERGFTQETQRSCCCFCQLIDPHFTPDPTWDRRTQPLPPGELKDLTVTKVALQTLTD